METGEPAEDSVTRTMTKNEFEWLIQDRSQTLYRNEFTHAMSPSGVFE